MGFDKEDGLNLPTPRVVGTLAKIVNPIGNAVVWNGNTLKPKARKVVMKLMLAKL